MHRKSADMTSDVILTMKWHVDDVREALRAKGVPPTDTNVLVFMRNNGPANCGDKVASISQDILEEVVADMKDENVF